jgi:hypothetical protein
MDSLSPAELERIRPFVDQFAQRWSRMSSEGQAEWVAAVKQDAQFHQIQAITEGTRDSAIAALRGEIEREPLVAHLERIAVQSIEGEEPGSPWPQLAVYLQAVVALLRGELPPAVPAPYEAYFAAIQATI